MSTIRTFNHAEYFEKVLPAMQKPFEQRTNEEQELVSAYLVYKREQERQKQARKQAETEKKRREQEEANTYRKQYWERVAMAERHQAYKTNVETNGQQGNDLNWFVNKLENGDSRNDIRPQMEPEKLMSYLDAAYQHIVTKHGMAFNAEASHKIVSDAARWMVKRKKNGLMLRGNMGVGKSTLMQAMSDTLRILKLASPVFVTSTQVVNAARNDERRYREIVEAECLCLDDLGNEKNSAKVYGNESNPITELLMERYDKRAYTIITSNLKSDEIQTLYGDRIADRMREWFNAIEYAGNQQSFRK